MASSASDETTPRYIIGVDLGTTNTVASYVDLSAPGDERTIEHFEVPQLVAPGELGRADRLPSFLYLPGPYDLPEGSLGLPWDAERDYAVGIMAQEQGAKVPGRLVDSAKSWLSHAGVDRTADILPWKAPHEVNQISPVEASARVLRHLREAWNERMAAGDEAARFARQHIILTVPASFDEVARELTVRAAHKAGIPNLVLLEEPLAAFYAWLDGHDDERAAMDDGELVLVCDVGGGTSDFSVIGVSHEAGEARFERLAVGDHLMLGGDNMDHALGRKIEADVAGKPGSLDVQRWNQLVHACRRAKETLLGGDPPDDVKVTVASRGSGLVSGTLSGTLRREDVEQLVLDGFFPDADLNTPLQESRRGGLTELGLPFEPDAAITRHLAAFWRRFQPLLRQETSRDDPRPDYILFNGGVFTPDSLRERLSRIVGHWFDANGAWQPTELESTRRDLAVARGAAHYGLVRMGERQRVGSGSARAYYVGVAAGEDADEDASGQSAVCLVPRGSEEGFAAHLDQMPVEALTNQPVTFNLFSSAVRTGDRFGNVVELDTDAGEVQALPPIRTVLRFGRKGIARALPVELGVRLTEVGTLELWCQSIETEHRWELAFDVRTEPSGDGAASEETAATLDLDRLDAAQDAVEAAFDANDPPGDPLWNQLEDLLGEPRNAWSIPILRKLSDTLLTLPHDQTPEHERAWYDLLGYTLRPGYGDDVDDWRLGEVWKEYMGGLTHDDNLDNRLAWWHFWQRVGGGLPTNKQEQIYYDARPYIQHRVRTKKRHPLYPRRLDQREKEAAWKALATFERLPEGVRGALGQIVLEQLERKMSASMLWAISRLGTRYPIYGPVDSLVPAEEVGGWLKTLLGLRLPRSERTGYALACMAQRTGDRSRDVPDSVRQQIVGRLRRVEDRALVAPLEDVEADLPAAARDWLMGEPLPAAGVVLPERHGIVYADDEE